MIFKRVQLDIHPFCYGCQASSSCTHGLQMPQAFFDWSLKRPEYSRLKLFPSFLLLPLEQKPLCRSQQLWAFQSQGSCLPQRAKNTDSFLTVLLPEGICWCWNLSRGKDDLKFHSADFHSHAQTHTHTYQCIRAGQPRQEEPVLWGDPLFEDSTWNTPSKRSQTPQNPPGTTQTGSLVVTKIDLFLCMFKKKAIVKTLGTAKEWFQECVVHSVWNISV